MPQPRLWRHCLEDGGAHLRRQRAGWPVAVQRSRKLVSGSEGGGRAFFEQRADQVSGVALVDVNAVDADLAAAHASRGTPRPDSSHLEMERSRTRQRGCRRSRRCWSSPSLKAAQIRSATYASTGRTIRTAAMTTTASMRQVYPSASRQTLSKYRAGRGHVPAAPSAPLEAISGRNEGSEPVPL
jgi:hypothetical protein